MTKFSFKSEFWDCSLQIFKKLHYLQTYRWTKNVVSIIESPLIMMSKSKVGSLNHYICSVQGVQETCPHKVKQIFGNSL